jgi:hypothetical protein
MADGASFGTAVAGTVPHSRPATAVSNIRACHGTVLGWWLIAVPLGCALMAGVTSGALSRFITVPMTTSSTGPTDAEGDDDIPTAYEIREGGSLRYFGPTFTR